MWVAGGIQSGLHSDPVGKNGKYEYCCLVSTISFGKYLRPIGCDLIYPTPLPRRSGTLWRLKSVKAGNFSKILLLLKL